MARPDKAAVGGQARVQAGRLERVDYVGREEPSSLPSVSGRCIHLELRRLVLSHGLRCIIVCYR